MELSQHLHLLIALVSAYLVLVFGWWWYRVDGATHIYKITFLLMFGICFTHFGAWYIYWQTSCGNQIVVHLSQWWWPYRQIFVLFPLVWYAVHITRKSCWGKKYYRRIDDL